MNKELLKKMLEELEEASEKEFEINVFREVRVSKSEVKFDLNRIIWHEKNHTLYLQALDTEIQFTVPVDVIEYDDIDDTWILSSKDEKTTISILS